MKKYLWVAVLGLGCSFFTEGWAAFSSFYDWAGPAFSGAPYGTVKTFSGDPDSDGLKNVEEYAFLTDPLVSNASPLSIQALSGSVSLNFPINRSASDLGWDISHKNSLTDNGQSWITASNTTVSTTENGDTDNLSVRFGENYGNTGFFRLNFSLADPIVITDVLDAGYGWMLYNQASFAASSGGLVPAAGTSFFKHSVETNWSHSGICKETGLTVKEGIYVITLNVGHDGSGVPFATNYVTIGLFDAAESISRAVDIRDAIDAFSSLTGVTKTILRDPAPNDGWETWRIEYTIPAGSDALGRNISLGIHAQSGLVADQAMFDGLIFTTPSEETQFDETVAIDVTNETAAIDPEMFGANLVYHKEKLDANFSNVFNQCGMKLLRYPGGGICETEFDYLDSDGPDNDRPSLSDVVHFCNANQTELMLVVPTKRFATNVAAGVQYAKDFVQAVNVDKIFGDIHVKYWELGNEYYAASPITADQYKVIADQFAAGMVSVDTNIVPIVQFRRSLLNDAQTISDYLNSSTNFGCVRAALTHAYPGTNSLAYVLQTEIPNQLTTGRSIFGMNDLFITEWNVESGADVIGMRLANYLLELFDSLARGGATKTTLWPLNWESNGVKTALSDYNTGVLRPPGQAFAWLAASASDSALVHSEFDYTQYGVSAFKKGSQELTLLISGRELSSPTRLRIFVNGFPFSTITAERMSKANELSHSLAETSAADCFLAGDTVYLDVNASNDWEIIKVTLQP